MRLSPVLLALGVMLAFLGLAMVPCALLDAALGHDQWAVFGLWAFAVTTVGIVMAISAGNARPKTGLREAFLLTVLVWVVLSFAAALPLIFVLPDRYTFTDAIFESVSGLTTTGATILTDLETLQEGTLLWRAILQWIGGIGIIVTAIAILPFLQVGGMQLFQVESSDQTGKFMPRVAEIAAQTGLVYLFLTVLCLILYAIAGMSAFDAFAHAMTTMAAGGYSTHDTSFQWFRENDAAGVIPVATVFMFLAGLPFALLALALLQGRITPLLRDPQPRLYTAIILVLVSLLVIWRMATGGDDGPGLLAVIESSAFNLVSVMTGTGYASAGYDEWGGFAVGIFFLATFLGGCAGSAACGIKMFRLEIAVKTLVAYAARMVRPHRIVPVRYGGKPVGETTLQAVMVFIFLYIATFMVAALLINLAGESPITAISAAAASVSNVGPGLGSAVGPNGNFGGLSDFSKWVCLIAMLLGRLEFISVFVLLMPEFWRG
jgi:trk system potassium uptake protein